MIPSYGESLISDSELLRTIRQDTLTTLQLKQVSVNADGSNL
jgi:hypothetical protein